MYTINEDYYQSVKIGTFIKNGVHYNIYRVRNTISYKRFSMVFYTLDALFDYLNKI